jgi:hypothetical protein
MVVLKSLKPDNWLCVVAASLCYDLRTSMLLSAVAAASACLQAARAICNLRDVTARELTPAITVLQLFLSSSKPVLRFAAVRTLNKVRLTAMVAKGPRLTVQYPAAAAFSPYAVASL